MQGSAHVALSHIRRTTLGENEHIATATDDAVPSTIELSKSKWTESGRRLRRPRGPVNRRCSGSYVSSTSTMVRYSATHMLIGSARIIITATESLIFTTSTQLPGILGSLSRNMSEHGCQSCLRN